MTLLVGTYKLICNIVYYFMKLKKTNNNKIVFFSRLSNKKSLDFKLIEEELKKKNENIECTFMCKRIETKGSGFLSTINYTFKCMNELSNAKVCIVDSYIPAVSLVKHKKELKIIQIWHSMGAIKKFGYQSFGYSSGRNERKSKLLNMHKNYDYIISGSKEMTKYFSKAFNYPETSFLNYGLPRIDYLIKNEEKIKKELYKEYPELKKKINILYAPTFRTTKEDKTKELIDSLDKDKFNLIIKGHTNQKLDNEINYKQFTSLELLCIADYVITDYSGIAIEAASINKKTIYYVYDYEAYKKNNGLNIDLYKEMKGLTFSKASDINNFLLNKEYDITKLLKYKNKYIDVQDGTSTEKIVNLIMECVNEKEN